MNQWFVIFGAGKAGIYMKQMNVFWSDTSSAKMVTGMWNFVYRVQFKLPYSLEGFCVLLFSEMLTYFLWEQHQEEVQGPWTPC